MVELAAKTAVGDIELEEYVAGGEVHLGQLAYVPCRHKEPTRVGVVLDVVDEGGYLVDVRAVGAAPRAPLVAVDGSQFAIGAGPFVPNADLMVVEVLHIGVATEKPQQLVDDGAQVQLLGGEEGKSVVEVEAHLVAESAEGARAGAVVFGHTIVEHML